MTYDFHFPFFLMLDIKNDCKGIGLNCIFAEGWRSHRNLETLTINSDKNTSYNSCAVIQKYPKQSFVELEHEADITTSVRRSSPLDWKKD